MSNLFSSRLWKQVHYLFAWIILATLFIALTPLPTVAYGQGDYYAQSTYYSQSTYYAQSYYQASYYAQSTYSGGVPVGTQTYATPGTYTFTVPAGVTGIKTFVVGGGGGGGGGAADWGGGGGGGCAGAINGQVLAVTPGQTFSVTVGGGGAGAGGSVQNGGVGGISQFGSLSAAGGGYGGHGYYGYPNTSGYPGGSGGGSGGGGGGNAYAGFYAIPGKGGTAGSQTDSAGSGGKCTGSGWSVNPQSYITQSSFAVGSGGYAPSTVYAYCGGGGGGGIVLNGSTVNGASGYAPTSGTYGPACAPNGGTGYGAGGGGAYYGGPAYGGAGAPGVVYVEWLPVSCTVTISPNPATYSASDTATLSYTSTNASVSMYINNVGYVSPGSGSFAVPRTATTNYSGTAVGSGGSGTCAAALSISSPAAPTATITSSAGATMELGESSTIAATITPASGDTLTHANIDSPVGTGLAANENPGVKTYTFTPTAAGTYTFYARAKTSYYTSYTTYDSVTVTVLAPCTLNGVTIQSGESATFYSSQISPIGGSCASIAETRTCTDGTLSGSAVYQYGSCSCAPVYSCSDNNVQYTNSSCVTSTVAACSAPSFCSPGESACLNPEPAFVETDDFSGNLEVRPGVVRSGDPTKVYWNVTNVQSCSVVGSNGNSWTGLTSGVSGKTTSPITTRTTFTLTCLALEGVDPDSITETATAIIIPIFQEQ